MVGFVLLDYVVTTTMGSDLDGIGDSFGEEAVVGDVVFAEEVCERELAS